MSAAFLRLRLVRLDRLGLTSTASAAWQCSPLDLNRQLPIAVGTARPQHTTTQQNHKHTINNQQSTTTIHNHKHTTTNRQSQTHSHKHTNHKHHHHSRKHNHSHNHTEATSTATKKQPQHTATPHNHNTQPQHTATTHNHNSQTQPQKHNHHSIISCVCGICVAGGHRVALLDTNWGPWHHPGANSLTLK